MQTAMSAAMIAIDGRVLPLATAAVEVAEQIRVRLMGIHNRLMGGDESRVSSLFSGKSPDGTPLRDHGHLFILPLMNGENRIDRVLLYCRLRPLESPELRAILGLRELYSPEDPRGLRCVASWQGKYEDGKVWRKARTVVSATPFVTVRHRKKKQTEDEFLEAEVRREFRNHQMNEPHSVRRIDKPAGMFQSIEFRRNRKDEPSRRGYAFELTFAEEVAAPFTLGYGCHYGLGQFIPG
jgi:CRISPR-associated protein Csb2